MSKAKRVTKAWGWPCGPNQSPDVFGMYQQFMLYLNRKDAIERAPSAGAVRQYTITLVDRMRAKHP